MEQRMIRLPEVKRLVGFGTTAIYEKMKHGEFPKPVKIGRLSAWIESEVQEWIKEKMLHRRGA